jgi:1,4-alpha-glucan branching enzyme
MQETASATVWSKSTYMLNKTTSPIKVQMMKKAGPMIRLLPQTVKSKYCDNEEDFSPQEHFHKDKVTEQAAIHAAVKQALARRQKSIKISLNRTMMLHPYIDIGRSLNRYVESPYANRCAIEEPTKMKINTNKKFKHLASSGP